MVTSEFQEEVHVSETADGTQLQYRWVEPGPDLGGPPGDYLNRAWLRDEAWPRAILENSGQASIPATFAIPVNSGVSMLAMVSQEADPANATVKWANSVADHAGPLPRELLVNPELQKVTVRAGVPVNEAMQPQEQG
jgi:hypothetical protein